MRCTRFTLGILVLACTLPLSAPAQELKMSETLHKKLIAENAEYKAADALLSRTWKLAQAQAKKIDPAYAQKLLDEQRHWVDMARNAAASAYAGKLDEAAAFTQATLDRANELAELTSVPVHERMTGEYTTAKGKDGFKVLMDAENRSVQLRLDMAGTDAPCWYASVPSPGRGWIVLNPGLEEDASVAQTRTEATAPVRVLFTPGGAALDAGTVTAICGKKVNFAGDYSQK